MTIHNLIRRGDESMARKFTIIACVALAGCMGGLLSGTARAANHCEIEEWYQYPGFEVETVGSENIKREGVIVKGITDCPFFTDILIRGYDSEGKLIGFGDGYIESSGTFIVFVESSWDYLETVKFRIEEKGTK